MSSSATGPLPNPATPVPPVDRKQLQPGWTELAVGIVVLLLLEIGVFLPVKAAGLDPVSFAVFMTALSAIVAGGGFAAAALVRIRSWAAFAVRRTSGRWLLLGLAGGVIATVLKIPASMAYTAISGDTSSPQADWSAASAGGVGTVILSFLFLAGLTPLCEELLFRGVVTTVLLRYGAVVGVVGSAAIFAIMHGLSVVTVSALLVGLLAAELRRRSGSVWPGVVLHVAFNLLSSVGLFLLLPALGA